MPTAQPTLRPRKPPVSFEGDLPRHWFGGAAGPTHLVNAVNLLFPAGERFFIRSVARYAERIDDPELRLQMKGFFGQEGNHAKAHEQFFDLLRRQGYDIDRFLKVYEWIAFSVIERVCPPSLRLATTAALEHFTAILAEDALRGSLELAHPTARALLLWHAAEEIEHRSVAFDVLRTVAPSYALRMGGLLVATLTLSAFWAMGVAMLHLQDVGRREAPAAPGNPPEQRSVVRGVFLHGIREYLRRDFHPSQNKCDDLARAYLAAAGIA